VINNNTNKRPSFLDCYCCCRLTWQSFNCNGLNKIVLMLKIKLRWGLKIIQSIEKRIEIEWMRITAFLFSTSIRNQFSLLVKNDWRKPQNNKCINMNLIWILMNTKDHTFNACASIWSHIHCWKRWYL
jgi:hypothetical protein